ncbi:MAG: SpoIIIAH-like family protein [Peptococcaceae bacterium]|jgi:stage III sporulation protein AH|nr:SpoIIIAH-like family protein [Peptococcaceae bacterium]
MRKAAGVSFLIRKNTLVGLGMATLFLICLVVGFGIADRGREDRGAADVMAAAAGSGGAGVRKENAADPSDARAAADGRAAAEDEPAAAGEAVSEERTAPEGDAAAEWDIYEGYRLERDRLRSEQVQILKEIAGSELYEDDRKREAQDRILRITEEREQELLIESALAAMGLDPCAALIQWDKAVVIAPPSLILPENARQIRELAAQVSGRAPEDMILIPGR